MSQTEYTLFILYHAPMREYIGIEIISLANVQRSPHDSDDMDV